jgi:hypothetical protein
MKKPATAWEAELRKALVAHYQHELEKTAASIAGLSDKARNRLVEQMLLEGTIPYDAGVALLTKSPKPA